jgi:VanZ family protein
MSLVDGTTFRAGSWLRWLVWGLANAALYLALVTPQPAQFANRVLPEETVFSASKLVHVMAYAILAGLSGWLRPSRRGRWLLLGWLSLHAISTEFLQQFVPSRGSSLRDVGLDHLGILLGVLATWRWWR